MLTLVHDIDESNDNTGSGRSLLDEIVRDGARQMLTAALKAEVAAYIEQFIDQVDENGLCPMLWPWAATRSATDYKVRIECSPLLLPGHDAGRNARGHPAYGASRAIESRCTAIEPARRQRRRRFTIAIFESAPKLNR
jgi:hypothetical protein